MWTLPVPENRNLEAGRMLDWQDHKVVADRPKRCEIINQNNPHFLVGERQSRIGKPGDSSDLHIDPSARQEAIHHRLVRTTRFEGDEVGALEVTGPIISREASGWLLGTAATRSTCPTCSIITSG